nr:HEAT repeat domain-containing protein [Pyxidicoccus fallax]
MLLAILAGVSAWRAGQWLWLREASRPDAWKAVPPSAPPSQEPPAEVTRQGVKGRERVLTPGRRHRYTFDLDTRTAEGLEPDRSRLHTGWSGALDLTYLGTEGGQHLFLGQVVPTRIELEAGETPVLSTDEQRELQAMLEQPVYVAQDVRGRVLAVHFDPAQDAMARRLVRSLLASTQFVAEDGSQWSTEETDTTGDFESEYRAGGSANTYMKTKRRYLRVATPDPRAPDGVPRMRGYLAVMLFEDGHVKEAAGSDVVESGGGTTGRPPVRAETRVALTHVAVDQRPASLGDFQAARARLRPERLSVREASGTAPPDRQLVGSASTAELMRLLARETEPKARDAARARLAALFRLEPAQAEYAANHVRRGEAGPALAAQVVEALGSAGTPESLRALTTVLEEARVRPETLAHAARMAGRVEHPTVELAEALGRTVDAARDEGVRNAAALAMGALVKELEPLQPARSHSLLDAMLRRCHARTMETAVCLRTLANAASPRGLAYTKSALLHPEPSVRAVAADALGGIPGAEVDALLDQVLRGDPSPRVRVRAVAAIGRRVAGPHMQALATVLRAEQSEQVRLETVRVLGGLRAVDELAVALLRDAADNDASEKVRHLAASLLAG